jgi:hypothetical protein
MAQLAAGDGSKEKVWIANDTIGDRPELCCPSDLIQRCWCLESRSIQRGRSTRYLLLLGAPAKGMELSMKNMIILHILNDPKIAHTPILICFKSFLSIPGSPAGTLYLLYDRYAESCDVLHLAACHRDYVLIYDTRKYVRALYWKRKLISRLGTTGRENSYHGSAQCIFYHFLPHSVILFDTCISKHFCP